MKVLLTGGAGFIGSHLAEKLLDEGHRVAVVDNLSVGQPEWVPEDAEFHQGDIRDSKFVEEVFESFDPDVLNHHAAHNDAMGSLEDPVEDASSNVIGSLKLLEAARENGVEKVIYASSGGLSYGEPQEVPTGEDHAMRPSYPYGISKHSFEHYLELYQQMYDLDFVVLRYASVYGPRPTGGVIKNFMEAAANGEKPVVFGDGSQTRDFIHVEDIVNANVRALERGSGFYNIGTCEETSVNELWQKIAAITGVKEDPEHRDRWPGDIDRCRLDYSKAEEELGWKPQVELGEGLEKLWSRHYQD
ncbi:MAG: NAD-dependent epimerase/dehydratase family protein [Candidatus Nanohaloarchaea archaeon]